MNSKNTYDYLNRIVKKLEGTEHYDGRVSLFGYLNRIAQNLEKRANITFKGRPGGTLFGYLERICRAVEAGAIDGGGSEESEVMIVHAINNGDGTFVMDKTFNEISNWYFDSRNNSIAVIEKNEQGFLIGTYYVTDSNQVGGEYNIVVAGPDQGGTEIITHKYTTLDPQGYPSYSPNGDEL